MNIVSQNRLDITNPIAATTDATADHASDSRVDDCWWCTPGHIAAGALPTRGNRQGTDSSVFHHRAVRGGLSAQSSSPKSRLTARVQHIRPSLRAATAWCRYSPSAQGTIRYGLRASRCSCTSRQGRPGSSSLSPGSSGYIWRSSARAVCSSARPPAVKRGLAHKPRSASSASSLATMRPGAATTAAYDSPGRPPSSLGRRRQGCRPRPSFQAGHRPAGAFE